VVTVREESQTNNSTRDYLTDLTYQCPKGVYKLGCSYDEDDLEYETSELLHHENIKYPQQVMCMMTISDDEEQVEFTSLIGKGSCSKAALLLIQFVLYCNKLYQVSVFRA